MGGEKTNRMGRRRPPLKPRQMVAIWGALTVAAAGALLIQLAASPILSTDQLRARQIVPAEAAALDQVLVARLRGAPTDTSAWVQRALLASQQEGRFGPAAVDLLDRSFRLTPLDPQVWDERDRLALDNWSSLPDDLRQKVTNEVALSAPVMPARAAALRADLNSLHDPTGRAAGLAMLK